MKKQIFSILAVFMMLGSLGFMMAGPVTQISLIGETPIYTEAYFVPLVFKNTNQGGRVLANDQYFNNGDIVARTNNYAFTGEQIQWKVLVWDKNGVPEKLNDVYAGWATQTNGPIAPDMQANCQYVRAIPATNLAAMGYPNVRRPIDQEAQVIGNPDTMGEYLCTLTIEPTCHGQKWLGIVAVDLDGNNGTMKEAESWFCNPTLDLTVSGKLNFGELGSGEQGYSTFSVKNNAETGSGTQVVLAISGTDFYDPSSSGAMCSTTNALKLQGEEAAGVFNTGFWYKATMGTLQTANKRIPYGNVISKADPVFSSSNGINAKWTGTLHPMSPGAETSMTLYLGIPQPCNGQFTSGNIYLYSWAI
jgi:hypothetical protein